MCVVSMIGDHYRDLWKERYPDPRNYPWTVVAGPGPTKEEFDELKRQVLELKMLLERARQYDAAHQQPNCENDLKMGLLREIAKKVGVELDDPK